MLRELKERVVGRTGNKGAAAREGEPGASATAVADAAAATGDADRRLLGLLVSRSLASRRKCLLMGYRLLLRMRRRQRN